MDGPTELTLFAPPAPLTPLASIVISGTPPSCGLAAASASWSARYGDRHRMRRMTAFPAGVSPPRKVRIYRRGERFLIQWWEPCQRKNVAERVEGDLIEAIGRARLVEARLTAFKTSGRVTGKLTHGELARRFLADLAARADAGEVAPATVSRYASALAHYAAFVETPAARAYPFAGTADRAFAQAFAAFLGARRVAANGVAAAAQRRMAGCASVWDAARAMFQWAADPDRGRLLPDGFRNPLLCRAAGRPAVAGDPFGEPDVTVAMAAAMLEVADEHQLRLLAP